jgi:lantibiotic biosynthesis protein
MLRRLGPDHEPARHRRMNPSLGPWRSLLSGKWEQEARSAVLEIAEQLAPCASRRGGNGSAVCPTYPALSIGFAGLALFFGYLHLGGVRGSHHRSAVRLLDRAFETIGEPHGSLGLFTGAAGPAWVLEHFKNLGIVDEEEDEAGDALAELIHRHLVRGSASGGFDLLGGWTGLGVYALERRQRPRGRDCLDLVLERLAAAALRSGSGLTWRTEAEELTEAARAECPEGQYNLGVAMGIPGVVSFLAAACSETGSAQARGLLEGSISWLREQRLEEGAASVYPYTISSAGRPSGRQVSWCYGDLTMAVVLLRAGRALGDAGLEAEAVELARGVALRAAEAVQVYDNGLCHGRAGVAHLLNRFFQATGDGDFEEAARAWYVATLEERVEGGIGGFRVRVMGRQGDDAWKDEAGFQSGAAGTGLALWAAIAPPCPDWDRVLLTSL